MNVCINVSEKRYIYAFYYCKLVPKNIFFNKLSMEVHVKPFENIHFKFKFQKVNIDGENHFLKL